MYSYVSENNFETYNQMCIPKFQKIILNPITKYVFQRFRNNFEPYNQIIVPTGYRINQKIFELFSASSFFTLFFFLYPLP